jgi:hypothetical protein
VPRLSRVTWSGPRCLVPIGDVAFSVVMQERL